MLSTRIALTMLLLPPMATMEMHRLHALPCTANHPCSTLVLLCCLYVSRAALLLQHVVHVVKKLLLPPS
jgi:hypothetical protein